MAFDPNDEDYLLVGTYAAMISTAVAASGGYDPWQTKLGRCAVGGASARGGGS